MAKFVPGLALFAAPVAGTLRMAFASFLTFDAIGALLYNVVVIGLGFALHDQLDRVVGWFRALGSAAIPLVVGAIVVFWVWRIVRKRRVIRALRGRRLTPQALRQRLESGEPRPDRRSEDGDRVRRDAGSRARSDSHGPRGSRHAPCRDSA